jgi:HPt (histidine-containing phosphotransfer) domain-containing protein
MPDSVCDSADQRLALAARIHKLRGSAGTVGARELHRLAGLAEASLRAADAQAIAALRALSTGLAALAAQSTAVLAARSAAVEDDDAEPDADGSDDRLALHRAASAAQSVRPLLQQLKSQDLAALESFNGLEPLLRGAFGRPAVAALSAALDELDFTRALELLTARLALETTAMAPDSSCAVAITD